MRNQHERFEKLAVGHVLGGLDADESAVFRNHLLGCRDCRMRVAELRDLAADLDAAERDERARAQVRTEVVRRDDEDHDEPATRTPRIGIRTVGIVAAIMIVFVGAMAFWNLHLRTAAASYAQAATYRADTLRGLAEGVPVTVDTVDDVSAQVAIDTDLVAFTVSGLPTLDTGNLAIWLLDADADATRALAPVPARNLTDGVVAGHVERGDAVTLLITHEPPVVGDAPGGRQLVSADLERPR